MDLGKIKWPVIILAVLGVIWFLSPAGAAYMYKRYSQGEPGANAELDKKNEAGLSFHGGLQLRMLQFKTAKRFLQTAVDRYPDGANHWANMARLAIIHERLGNFAEAADIMDMLVANNAHERDGRVSSNDYLRARSEKLREVHEIYPTSRFRK